MPDLLVKLYDIPSCEGLIGKLSTEGIQIKRAMSADLTAIRRFITNEFSLQWADEATRAILRSPSSCYIAVEKGVIVGFAAYDATAKGFFGPTGVKESMRGRGVGKALYLKCLHSMYECGYAYGIVGAAGPVGFYQKQANAMVIPDCWPGEYKNLAAVEPDGTHSPAGE